MVRWKVLTKGREANVERINNRQNPYIGFDMQELLIKYQQLPPKSQKTLLEFLDFLLSKKDHDNGEASTNIDPWLTIGVWSEQDIQPVLEAGKRLNSLKSKEW